MSLDVYLEGAWCDRCGRGGECLYSANITHNLNKMAGAASIYEALWRPDEHGLLVAKQLIAPLRRGLDWLKANRVEAEKHNAANGWGLYEHFVPFVERYLKACENYPNALVRVSR